MSKAVKHCPLLDDMVKLSEHTRERRKQTSFFHSKNIFTFICLCLLVDYLLSATNKVLVYEKAFRSISLKTKSHDTPMSMQ